MASAHVRERRRAAELALSGGYVRHVRDAARVGPVSIVDRTVDVDRHAAECIDDVGEAGEVEFDVVVDRQPRVLLDRLVFKLDIE